MGHSDSALKIATRPSKDTIRFFQRVAHSDPLVWNLSMTECVINGKPSHCVRRCQTGKPRKKACADLRETSVDQAASEKTLVNQNL